MPTYEYHCPTNGQTIEVWHSMRETLSQWGELCERAGLETGSTPRHAPIHKRITTGMFLGKPGSKVSDWAGSCCGDAGCAG